MNTARLPFLPQSLFIALTAVSQNQSTITSNTASTATPRAPMRPPAFSGQVPGPGAAANVSYVWVGDRPAVPPGWEVSALPALAKKDAVWHYTPEERVNWREDWLLDRPSKTVEDKFFDPELDDFYPLPRKAAPPKTKAPQPPPRPLAPKNVGFTRPTTRPQAADSPLWQPRPEPRPVRISRPYPGHGVQRA